VLGTRLQEARKKTPKNDDNSVCDTEDEPEHEDEEEDEYEDVPEQEGAELSPFVYRRRKITDQYSERYVHQDAHAKPRACCGLHTAPEDLPWWQRLFL